MPKICLTLLLLTLATPVNALDVFDRHTPYWLRQATKDAQPLAEISAKQADGLKRLDAKLENPCLIIKTNEGHLAKALITWGFRKGQEKNVPVLLIERFVTYSGSGEVTSATGGNVMLFPGFQFNFDIGQVVPAGHGGDVEFTAGGLLKSTDEAKLYTLSGSALPPVGEEEAGAPTDHDGVIPEDFGGNWKVTIDGRWSGEMVLSVDDEGTVMGKYVSNETKSGYTVEGRVTKNVAHRMSMVIDFGNSKQVFESFLWTSDKSTMAGTTQVDTQRFGFVAHRVKSDK